MTMNLSKDLTIRFSVIETSILFNGLNNAHRTMLRVRAIPNNRPIQFPNGEVLYLDGETKDGTKSELEIKISIDEVSYENGVYGFFTFTEYWGADVVLSATKEQIDRICNLVANNKKINDISVCVRNGKNESSASQMFEMKKDQYEIEHWEFSVSV